MNDNVWKQTENELDKKNPRMCEEFYLPISKLTAIWMYCL